MFSKFCIAKMFIYIFCSILFFCGVGCDQTPTEISYLGKTRDEVLNMCEAGKDDAAPPEYAVYIRAGSSFKGYKSAAKARLDPYLMSEKTWSVNFKKGRYYLQGCFYFYRLDFDSRGIVINQKFSRMML